MESTISFKEMRQRDAHQEILGETLAKFEFFQHGWHPYTRFLDVDKVDLILRRRRGNMVEYRDVQVKFGKLYPCGAAWDRALFSVTSWRFFKNKDIDDFSSRDKLYISYVLSEDEGYTGDIFLFRAPDFAEIIKKSHNLENGKYRLYISKTLGKDPKWYVRRSRKFNNFDDINVLDVTAYRRNFSCLG